MFEVIFKKSFIKKNVEQSQKVTRLVKKTY